MNARLGYARVSTLGQDLESQRQRLIDAGAARIFLRTASSHTHLDLCPPGNRQGDRKSSERLLAQLEFLRPALALPRFSAGTGFRIVAGTSVVGEGRVLARLG